MDIQGGIEMPPEVRSQLQCSSHEDISRALGRIEEFMEHSKGTDEVLFQKLAILSTNQDKHTLVLADVQRIVNNGLKGEMIDIKKEMFQMKKSVEALSGTLEKKIADDDKINWASKAITKFRDSVFYTFVKIGIGAIIILSIIHLTGVDLLTLIKIVAS